jgi:hypothetical protein
MTFFVEGLTGSLDIDQQVRRIGEFSVLEEAVAAAKQIIDEFLAREFAPGMPPARLFARYQSSGEVPIIFRDDSDDTMNVSYFNHFEYALARCADLAVPAGGLRG